jgi:hypothetical protein
MLDTGSINCSVKIRILSAMLSTLKIHSNTVGFINPNSIMQMQEA